MSTAGIHESASAGLVSLTSNPRPSPLTQLGLIVMVPVADGSIHTYP